MATNSPVVPSLSPRSVTCGPGRQASDESITWNSGWVTTMLSELSPTPTAASCTARCASATSRAGRGERMPAIGNSIATAAVAKWEGELLPADEAERNAVNLDAAMPVAHA